MAGKSTETKPKTSVEHFGKSWPVLSASEAATMCNFSSDMLRQLERAGRFKKLARDAYDPIAVLRGLLEHYRDDTRRHSKSAEARAVQAARAEEIQLRIAREQGRLVYLDSAEAVIGEVVGTFRSRLAGVPAASTRDLATRDAIEREVEAAVVDCQAHFSRKKQQLMAEARRGRRD